MHHHERLADRWIASLTALFVAGPVAGWMMTRLHAPDGSGAATPLLSQSVLLGVAVTLGVFALAWIWGVVAARRTSVRFGLFTAGLVLAWAAWGTTTTNELVRSGNGNVMLRLAVEAIMVSTLGLATAWSIVRAAKRAGRLGEDARPLGFDSSASIAAIIVMSAVGGVVTFLVAQEAMKGQTVMGAVAGCIAGAAMARAGIRNESPILMAFVGAAVLAVASPAIGAAMHGSSVLRAATDDSLFALARLVPLDWMAGAFLGIPMGLSVARSMSDKPA